MATANHPEYLVEGVGVSKVFRDFWGRPRVQAVSNVDFRIRQGSVFGLLGPNGAGKSTLIKMLLGHLYPTAGRILVLGCPPTDVEAKRRLGYLPERAQLYKNLTAAETLDFFGEILELGADVVRSRREQLLGMVGLEGAAHRLVGEYSHGMARRLGLAQALLNDPDLLLLDEPTAGLDPIGCREVKNLILTLARRGKTILLTSHLLADVEDVCDEILIMYGGKVLASGRTGELLREKDALQIRLPAPDPQQLRELHELLAQRVGKDQVEFSSPTRSLENYFLEVVREASTKAETNGARMGKGVAAYLRQGVAEPEEVLEALRFAHPAPEVPAPPATPPAPAVDQATLKQLASEHRPEPAPPPAPDSSESVDQDLLNKLSGKK